MTGILNPHSLDKLEHYLERHFRHLEEIADKLEAVAPREEFYLRRKSAVQLDATGAGQIAYPVPLGYDWELQRLTVTSAANGQAAVYIDTTNPQDVVEIIGSSQLYSDAFDNNIFAPSGSMVFVVFTAAGANGTATVNMQIKQMKREPKMETRRHSFEIGSA